MGCISQYNIDISDLTNNSVDFYTNGSPTERNVGSRTILASDGDVANGFVKKGTQLLYVYETNESGSSKILPVCGECGMKFVSVTTMKRHLVTHTRETPFSCKDCGKQYTQKGNLRVHERTHRNDRPFHCNICQQKFYRKEPMQKHQWRQHGIGHLKSHTTNTFAANATSSPLRMIEEARINNGNRGISQISQHVETKETDKNKVNKKQEERDSHISLPTHIITDTLTCIGCMLKFQHKPELNAHQCSNDKERPFRCCICGYDFRQKAHLQKHQWRIHQRKMEPDPSKEESTTFLQVVDSILPTPIQKDQITLSKPDIIDRVVENKLNQGVEHEMNRGVNHETNQEFEDEIQREIERIFQEPDIAYLQTQDGSEPLDLSPTKIYGCDLSITKWVQQVETERTHIIQDIFKKPHLPTIPLSQESQEEHSVAHATVKPPQYKIIKPILPNSENLNIQLLDPIGVKWPTEPLPQRFAIKSKPSVELTRNSSLIPSFKGSNKWADNPFLNQGLLSELPSIPLPQHISDHTNKSLRTDLPRSHSTLPSTNSLQKPMSYVQSPHSLLTLPSLSYATDLCVKHPRNPSSSLPMNLSSDKSSLSSKYYSGMPFEYTFGQNLSLRDL